MKKLTSRQNEVLGFIKEYLSEHRYPPTIREIASFFSISVKGAYDHVKALEKKGHLRSGSSKSRALEIISNEESRDEEVLDIPILGNVAAGIPLFAEENLEGHVKIPASQLSRGEHFALQVKGDSMQNAGILDGDTAIFLKTETALNGDIIVARINDEAVTLKRFFREKNRIKLKSENPVYPPIYTQNVRILGKLQHLIRNYE
ncbi:transcriptional repressor LexA [Marispirochaeta sp.]|jgi:repressor LexA|uniref:transcriptional repressor LexA n=1 Tax=Marispirochaeta sp. TaxID=2038653 RepID=UPI0029C82BCC|nr:transcriptional repressor LexA [Marispirochaeta sp.]